MEKNHPATHGKMNMYWHLAITTAISAIVMYLVMFVMIDRLSSFYNNINMFYMTLMMVAPMVMVMIPGMGAMYTNKKLNYALIAAFAVIFFLSWALIRWQYPVGDRQFLRSMIPHHSGAILMCQEAELSDPEIVKLCGQIIESQEQEIQQMRAILERSR
jgi:small-conductance mechanosensitive channel